MDAMQLAQMKRTAAWHADEVRHIEHDLQSAELALENDKKKVEELRKKLVENKRKQDQLNQDIVHAVEEERKKIANERH